MIEDRVWSAGPEAVAIQIERIKAEIVSERLPQAEAIELNSETNRFRVVPIPQQNPQFLSALLTSISDALEDSILRGNGITERSNEYRKITRVITRYGNNPQQAELTLTTVAKGLYRQIHETKELPDSEDNLALLEAVENGVRGIRANHPEIATNREQLARQAFAELDDDAKQVLEQAQTILADLSEGELAEDFSEDIPALVNDILLPLPDRAPALPGADAATRVFSRTSKICIASGESTQEWRATA